MRRSAAYGRKEAGHETHIVVRASHDDCTDHEKPIDPRDVDLAVEDLGSMAQLDLGEVGELDDL